MRPSVAAVAGALALLAAACTSPEPPGLPPNERPPGLRGPIVETSYDGVTDDLLTGGLGTTGLMLAAPPFVDQTRPSPAELRRNAIHTNYRALVDFTPPGGMGVFYGPNIDTAGRNTLGEGKIAGREYVVWADDGSGRQNVTLLVQVPDRFDPAAACIVTATSSGSRGVYGAIGTAGDWGLKHGCAVAYTDKGTGNGLHDLTYGTVTARDGTLLDAASAGPESLFTAAVGDAELAAFNAATPNRVAYKHAHSQQNPESAWGRNTLDAVRFAFYVLNELFGPPIPGGGHGVSLTARNTLVIASSASNGGGAALAAAEQDRDGLIDGVAVAEPNAQPRSTQGVTIRQGGTVQPAIGKPLADYFSFAAVYQPCALLSAQVGLSVGALFWPPEYTTSAQHRCAGLAAKGLATGATTAEQADDALARMLAYGWLVDSNFQQQSHFRLTTNAITVTYTNAYGRFSVLDRLCDFSFAHTDAAGAVVPQVRQVQAGLFATGSGIPPTPPVPGAVNIVYDRSVDGARLDFAAVSPSTGLADFALDGALCQRSLVTGRDAVTGAPLDGEQRARSERLRQGIGETQLGGDLGGKPTLIVAGRSDTLLPVNHAARAYFALTQAGGPPGANTRYVEVTNAQHFDTFIAFGPLLGYDTRYVPLHVYFTRAMDAMWAHLTSGAPLPASQLVRTKPRGEAAPPLTEDNVPEIQANPAPADTITFNAGTLTVPD